VTTFSVAGKRVAVVGAGRSGMAAAELLARRGARVVLTESRASIDEPDRLRAAGIDLELGGHRQETLCGSELIVVSPGVPLTQPAIGAARRAGVPVIGEIELASRWLQGRIVAITGTKGKSTTTTLAGRMLSRGGFDVLVGGNIGQALSAQVERSTPESIHVVEVSSFQLATIHTFHPWVAVFLNFSPDHLDWHPDEAAYAAAKARIFVNQQDTDWAVINADDPQVLALAQGGRARQLRFALERALENGVVLDADRVVYRSERGDRALVPLSAVRLLGRHQLNDVLAAAAIGVVAGLELPAMVAAVESFTGLEHALEPVGEIAGVRFVNDSKATNVAAARRSIESFGAGLVPILGGRFKGGDLRELREPLATRAVAAIAIGEARPLIREVLGDVVPFQEADSLESAVRAAFAAARPEGTVLLAPACASFDMFHDYADRGRQFKEEVARLARELGGESMPEP
jgi:UDP-N-acetylmuramoylalanine--D-glutamate ligase